MNASGPVASPARARDTCPETSSITVVGLVRRDGTREGFLEGVLPSGDPIGRTKAFVAAIVARQGNINHGGLDRTSERLRGIGNVDRRGTREDRSVGESRVFVRPFTVGGVLFSGGYSSGGVDRRCSDVSKIRRHGHTAVIGHGQVANERGGTSNISSRGNPLPLAGDARDLRDGGLFCCRQWRS